MLSLGVLGVRIFGKVILLPRLHSLPGKKECAVTADVDTTRGGSAVWRCPSSMLIISAEEEEPSWWEWNLALRSSEKQVLSKSTCCKVLTALQFPSRDDWKVKASRILVVSAGGSSDMGPEHPKPCSELTVGNTFLSVERFQLDGSDMSFSMLWESRDLSSPFSVKVSLARTMFAEERTCEEGPV